MSRTQADSGLGHGAALAARPDVLHEYLARLQLPYMREHFETLAQQAATEQWSHLDYFAPLVEGEAHRREERSIRRRIRLARFPVLKTLEQFQWSWPRKINRAQIQNLFRLRFVEEKSNVVFIGGVGLGKTHFSIALGHTACVRGYSVLFTTAIDIINTLSAAPAAGALKRALGNYLRPRLLVIDLCVVRSHVEHWPEAAISRSERRRTYSP